jgi:hypothetical protein
MSLTAKDSLSKFIKESSIEGVFRTTIEAEATKLNLNSVLDAFYKPVPQPSPSPGASPTPTPTASPTPAPTAADAEKLIVDTFTNIFNEKVKTDEDFAAEYRGFDLDEFRDTLLTYLNNKHVPRLGKWDEIPPKKAPMYSIKELRLLPTMDDTLYELFAPNFTVFPTGTLNVNKLKKQEFLSLFATANIKEEEVDDLLTFRDSPPDVDYPTRGPFPGIKEFIIYLTNNISYFGKDQNKVENYIKSTFEPAGIVLSVSTDVFKITSTGIVGPDQASLDANVTRKIEAWVTLLTPPTPPPTGINPNQPQAPPTPNTGLKINFMRIY